LHHNLLAEPLETLANHVAKEFTSVARELIVSAPVHSVFVIAQEPAGEWFARALSEHSAVEELFPDGGTVRAMRGSHVSPYISMHAPKPDLPLLLEALFVDARFVR
jgi:hypothetical protein